MNIALHLEFSQVIRKAVEKELDIKLDALSFMYGNIKPDVIRTSIPHYKHTAMEFVQTEIEKLASLKFNKSKKWLKHFSGRLGIITHYLADFFCYAHSEVFQGDIMSHFLYEFWQSYYFIRSQKVVCWYIPMTPTYLQLSANYLTSCIEAAHDRYRSILKDNLFLYEWDTANAVSICVIVCVALISMCIENQLKFAV
ncbi:MAG: zinc dependent phospholipase C family protein [Desulfosporosinus sp.]|nr:zinc dependent phospholipase C family protein [Desulfosporosinus sp.]